MHTSLADIFNEADKDDAIRVVLWHGAGDAFCAGNDIGDFLKNPPGPGEFPQGRLMDALVEFDKPIVAAVQGAAICGGTTMLTHCDFVYAGESAKSRCRSSISASCCPGTEEARALQKWRLLVRRDAVADPNGWSVESIVSEGKLLNPSMTKSTNEVIHEPDVGRDPI
jgi:hypothetical protein